jgi:hypothetical protein
MKFIIGRIYGQTIAGTLFRQKVIKQNGRINNNDYYLVENCDTGFRHSLPASSLHEIEPVHNTKELIDKIAVSNIINDTFVRNQFNERNLQLHEVDQVTLVFRGKLVHVHGHISTESHSTDIAIMKYLIILDILK